MQTPLDDRRKPPPAEVRGNDWRSIGVAPIEVFQPLLSATVVIPSGPSTEQLELLLAALERQTYPRDLFEVIVVGDDLPTGFELAEHFSLNGCVIRSDGPLGAATCGRTQAVSAASGDILVFASGDALPEADWLASHVRWHHAAADLLTLGFRRCVDLTGVSPADLRDRPGSLAGLVEERPHRAPERVEEQMFQTDDLTSDADDVFRVIADRDFAVSRAFFDLVGPFDGSLPDWDSQNLEFGWRAYARGVVFVPERGALCWQHGEGDPADEGEEVPVSEDETERLPGHVDGLVHLIPHRRLRAPVAGRSYPVPQTVVSVQPGPAAESDIETTVDKLLASDIHDLAVWVEERPGERFERLHERLEPDPRVGIGAAGGAPHAHPAAAFHVRVPAGADVRPRMLGRLQSQLGAAAAGNSDLASGHRVGITRGWAVHRALRSERAVAELGAVLELDVDSLLVTQEAKPRGWLASRLHHPARWLLRMWARVRRHLGTLWMGLRNIRHPRDVARLLAVLATAVGWRLRNVLWRLRKLRWIVRGVLWRLRKLRWIVRGVRWRARRLRFTLRRMRRQGPRRLRVWLGLQSRSQQYVQRLARYPLGANFAATGRSASAVMAASTRVASHLGDGGDHHVDVVMTDSPERAEAMLRMTSLERPPAIAVLAELPPRLSVQAFNPEAVNPVGWTATWEGEGTSLRSRVKFSRGSVFSLQLGGELLSELRSQHHVVDASDDHRHAAERAGALAALAAAGVVISIDGSDQALADSLGPSLHRLMASDEVVDAGLHRREQLSIAMRRCALRDHSLRSRAHQVLSAVGKGVPLPEVSILAPTRRPDRVADVVQIAARQTYPRLELALALHGEGFQSDAEIAAMADDVGVSLRIVRVDGAEPLGSVLRAAAQAAGGSLLTKMDDDDYYGAEHVWDLALAHEYSRAELIGKSAEYVYLERLDKTVRDENRQKFSERYVPFVGVSGGVLMISRHNLEEAGGWRRVPRRVDIALAQDVAALGGRIYWTHGAGYLRVRHGDEHTWNVDDSHFLGRASEVRDGCDLAFAGVEEA